MKRTMKRGLLVLLACIFSLGLLAAAPVTARADGVPAISGSSGAETTFYLYASSSGYVKLEATRGAAYVMNYDFYGNYTGSGAEEMYGFYRVTITKAGTPAKTYIWAPSAALNTYGTETRSSILVTFSGYGDYKVTVTPLMKNEINKSVSDIKKEVTNLNTPPKAPKEEPKAPEEAPAAEQATAEEPVVKAEEPVREPAAEASVPKAAAEEAATTPSSEQN